MTKIKGAVNLKVAIIGAGLAGIVCAKQFEKWDVPYDIFEKNDAPVEPYRHVGAALEIVLRPIRDPLVYLKQTYDISFKPSGTVHKIVHKGPHVCRTITGGLGYLLHRGSQPGSIDRQLAGTLKNSIILNREVDYRELKKEYDYVVVASGNPFEAKQEGIWQDTITMSIKGTVVTGDFVEDTFIVWINKDYCRSGYAYLAPFSSNEASLVLAVDGIAIDEIDTYWERFIKSENIGYKIIEDFKCNHYAGFAYPHRVDNLYFIGNAGGVLDPLLGFGVFPTVVTASEAVKSIVSGADYESGIKPVMALNKKLLEFRKTFNMLNNKDYDRLIRLIGLPGLSALVYRTKLNVVTLGHALLKPFNALLKE